MKRSIVTKLILCLALVLLSSALYLRSPKVVLADTIYVSGAISTNTTWTAGNLYVVQGDVTVAQGVSLTIEPGVIVKFQDNARLIVNGVLNARGTAGNQIVFTSYKDDTHGGDTNGDGSASAPAPNDWGWIEFRDSSVDSQNFLEHCSFRYGGEIYNSWSGSTYRGVVYLASASPTISQCTFSHNGTYAIGIDTGSFPTVTGNTFTGNGTNGIGVYGGTISTAGTWTSTDYPYVPDGDIAVAEGASLTISPGVVVKGKTNTRLIVNGVLDARGTTSDQIVFTSYKDDAHGGDTNGDGATTSSSPGDWRHIWFSNPGVHSVLEYVVVRYGGYGGYMVRSNGAYLTLQHALLEYSSGDGLYIYHESDDPDVTVRYCTFRLNNGSGVRVVGP